MTYVYQTEEGAAKASARSQAYHAALRRFRQAHYAEWIEIHREERVARGLPPDPMPKQATYTELLERVKELEAELAQTRGAE